MEEKKDNKMIPVVTLRDIVVFPGTTVYFEIGREATINAVNEAMHGDKLIFTVAQKDQYKDNPGLDDVFETGTLAEVKQIITLPDKVMRVVIVGLK